MLTDVWKKISLLSNLSEKMILTFTIQCILGNHELDCAERTHARYYANIHLWEHTWDALRSSQS